MLKNILEKDIMQMLRLSTTLLTENPLPLNKAAADQNLSVKTIRRLLSSYLNEDPSFHYDVQQGHIRANHHLQQPLNSLSHTEMIAALFNKSVNYQLLLLLLKMPTISFCRPLQTLLSEPIQFASALFVLFLFFSTLSTKYRPSQFSFDYWQ